jgi:hypothetical protein
MLLSEIRKRFERFTEARSLNVLVRERERMRDLKCGARRSSFFFPCFQVLFFGNYKYNLNAFRARTEMGEAQSFIKSSLGFRCCELLLASYQALVIKAVSSDKLWKCWRMNFNGLSVGR